MNKTMAGWAFRALTIVGGVLIASMFFAWIDFGPWSKSGLGLAWDDNTWLFLVPISGALLCATAGTKSQYTRIAAVFAGVVVTGDVLFNVGKGILHGGLESWLVFGGAGAILAGGFGKTKELRVLGGLAVLAGFFAPWTSHSMFSTLTSSRADFASAMGVTVAILWVIPVAALAAIAFANHKEGGKAAIGAGITIFGAILWVMFSAAKLVFGLGAWAALGASTVALVLGVLAPAGIAAAAATTLPRAKATEKKQA